MIANVMPNSAPETERPKTSKHMMERKRRARINDSLLQLKSLIFPALRKEMSRQPKMEKADILEMTVRYLKEVQSSPQNGRTSPAAQVSQYHAGYNECLGEASNFLANCESVDLDTRLRIMNHLAERCSGLEPTVPTQQQQQKQVTYNFTAPKQSTLTSPAVSPVSVATNSRVPPMTSCTVQQQQQLMLCIPHDFPSQTNPSLLSHSSTSTQSSIIFPTPPPSPVEVSPAPPAQSCTQIATEYRPKIKSAVAASYRRRHAAVSNTVARENVWRPW
ncbi:transcription factor HES-4-B-like [Acanthaster planci]|uniref:Transcription factor HES-4-B-like n=1 Tax=Acanthaster planci TaxID=133434 RepID=A0A8B7ZER8_ACAPL|nr:transcription factor HES-4-B-like [Acanthaster planci]